MLGDLSQGEKGPLNVSMGWLTDCAGYATLVRDLRWEKKEMRVTRLERVMVSAVSLREILGQCIDFIAGISTDGQVPQKLREDAGILLSITLGSTKEFDDAQAALPKINPQPRTKT